MTQITSTIGETAHTRKSSLVSMMKRTGYAIALLVYASVTLSVMPTRVFAADIPNIPDCLLTSSNWVSVNSITLPTAMVLSGEEGTLGYALAIYSGALKDHVTGCNERIYGGTGNNQLDTQIDLTGLAAPISITKALTTTKTLKLYSTTPVALTLEYYGLTYKMSKPTAQNHCMVSFGDQISNVEVDIQNITYTVGSGTNKWTGVDAFCGAGVTGGKVKFCKGSDCRTQAQWKSDSGETPPPVVVVGLDSEDDDGDTWCEDALIRKDTDTPLDGVCNGGYVGADGRVDCNDDNAAIHPGAAEIPNDGVDNNCNGDIDEVPDYPTSGTDPDGPDHDGYCVYDATDTTPHNEDSNKTDANYECDDLNDLNGDGTIDASDYDCDDTSDKANPETSEGTNGDGIDNDCDLQVDEGTTWDDKDGDQWCTSIDNNFDTDQDGICETGEKLADKPNDCDDTNAKANPGMTKDYSGSADGDEELFTGIDNDCDGATDEDGLPSGAVQSCTTDADADGAISKACAGGTDCNDADAAIKPGTETLCNDGIDNDCDGQVDENDGNCSAEVPVGCDIDVDGDGFNPPSDTCTTGSDCDDTNAEINIAADEAGDPATAAVCKDGKDNDCDGKVDTQDPECVAPVAVVDTDGDGIKDNVDNCDTEKNPTQEDCDGDGIGFVCDDNEESLDDAVLAACFDDRSGSGNENPNADSKSGGCSLVEAY